MSKNPHQTLKYGNGRKTYKELRNMQTEEESTSKSVRRDRLYDKRLQHALKVRDIQELIQLEEEH